MLEIICMRTNDDQDEETEKREGTHATLFGSSGRVVAEVAAAGLPSDLMNIIK